MKRFLIAGVIALAAAAVPSTAAAAPFTGQIDYTGVHTPDNNDMDLATQSTIDVNFVVIANGSFAAIPLGTTLDHTSPLVYRPAGTPYTPLWSDAGSGIAFDLETLEIVTSTTLQLGLEGTGTFYCFAAPCAGLDPTAGVWNMTLNITDGATSGSFSSSSSVPPVPEPATTALFGLAMAAAGLVARRRARAQAQA
jgi:hypothetical protein